MKYVKSISAFLLLSTCSNLAPAESPCDYDSSVNTQYTKTIEKTSDFKKRVFPYVEDTRKCVINMNVTIDGKTYPTMGDFVFGPDISENSACKNAENRAKEMIVRKVSPEVLSANTDMKCTVKTEEIVKVEKPKEIQKVVTQNQYPQVGTVLSTQVVEVQKVIPRYEPIQNHGSSNILGNLLSNFSLGNVTIKINNSKRGKCFANWSTGGKDCYY